MRDLQIFQYIFDEIETPFIRSVSDIVSALISYAATPLQTALILYIALTGILMMRGQGGEAVSGLVGRVIKFAIVAWFATNGSVYATWVQDFFLNVLPNDITRAISSAGSGGVTISANSFDAVWKQSYEAGLRVWKLLDFLDIGEKIVIFGFWLGAMLACIVSFAIWFLSHVLLGLFIVIGPLMLGLVLFPTTKPIFERWIGAMISCVILQVVTVLLVTLTLQVETQIVQKIMVYKGVNPFEQLRVLLAGMIFFVFSAIIALQLPGFATSLSGGLQFHTGAVARSIAAGGRFAGQTAAATGRATAAVAGRGVAAVRQRIRPSTGGSLSRGSPPPAE